MKQLTEKEKLDLCINFLNQLQNVEKSMIMPNRSEDSFAFDDEDDDGMNKIIIRSSEDSPIYTQNDIDTIKDSAWHLLMDIS